MALLAAAAVALAVAAASGVVYVVVRHQLREELDRSLVDRARQIALRPGPRLGIGPGGPRPPLGGPPSFVQVVRADGGGIQIHLPGGDLVREVAAGERRPFFAEGDVNGEHVRVYVAPAGPGRAVQVARPLAEIDRTLHDVGFYLLVIGLGGIGIAAALGLLVATAALAPVARLTRIAEEVAETRDLSRRIESASADELGRLASAFNQMLEALETSVKAQRQLVADASHELRTPLASLRTNIEVLAGEKELEADERRRLLADLLAQAQELSTLVGDLVELDRETPPELEPVRLDELVSASLKRARGRAPGVAFRAELEPSLVRAAPAQIDRAVSNLLDNAAKWSDSVELHVSGSEVTVRDHGPGIAEADLPHLFDRFYRAADARHLPGSGLGLAIVRQVASSHGGEATAENAPGGGALFRLRLPSNG